ncbi:unnamed protein product [Callosobruchus maculatus]|uniref:Uncharacterized protein n=1 Tax=Callosobruchus maculatus TaxID=64391 RepID=A0A653CNE5_CALMS|nr:unnamed protein product [Callosobruchus maculatus]
MAVYSDGGVIEDHRQNVANGDSVFLTSLFSQIRCRRGRLLRSGSSFLPHLDSSNVETSFTIVFIYLFELCVLLTCNVIYQG